MTRRLGTRADEELRERFKLADWIHKIQTRRELYFRHCDRAAEDLKLFAQAQPKDESIVLMLMAAVSEDDSFAAHVRKRRGSFLTEDENWDKLYRAAATAILQEHRDAVENERWP